MTSIMAAMRCVKSMWSAGVALADGKTSIMVGRARRMKTTIMRDERIVVRVRSNRSRFWSYPETKMVPPRTCRYRLY